MLSFPRAKIPLVLLLFLLLDLTVLSRLRVAGAAPDVMLLLAIAAGVVGGPQLGALMGFAAGLVLDLFLETPLGLSALVSYRPRSPPVCGRRRSRPRCSGTTTTRPNRGSGLRVRPARSPAASRAAVANPASSTYKSANQSPCAGAHRHIQYIAMTLIKAWPLGDAHYSAAAVYVIARLRIRRVCENRHHHRRQLLRNY